ncbi:MAG TPA: hypothetical protein VEI02_05645, partial [Planctomycetota bacterium]|nr:hypothetical protein [Planctomycetota bacterium]
MTVRRLTTCLFAFGVVLGSAAIRCQTPETGPATRPFDPNDDVERRLVDLRNATSAGSAGIKAAGILGLGPEARRRLLDMLANKPVSDAVLEGVVSAFEEHGDATDVVTVLLGAFGRGDPGRDRFLSARLKSFDRRTSLTDGILEEIRRSEDVENRRRLLRLLPDLADEPGERLAAVQRLIEGLADPKRQTEAAELRATLERITNHDFAAVAQWQAWFPRFLAENPEGLTDAALFRSAMKRVTEQLVQEAQSNIDRLAQAKTMPADYLDRNRYSLPQIRIHAAQAMAGFKEAAPELVAESVGRLLAAAAAETHEDVVAALLLAAGELATPGTAERTESARALAASVADAATARLGATSTTVVNAALRAL